MSDTANSPSATSEPAVLDLVVTNAKAILGGANGEQYRVVPDTSIEMSAGTIS